MVSPDVMDIGSEYFVVYLSYVYVYLVDIYLVYVWLCRATYCSIVSTSMLGVSHAVQTLEVYTE